MEQPTIKKSAANFSLMGYTLAHFVVDLLCHFYLYRQIWPMAQKMQNFTLPASSLIIYNVVAFGLQFVWGFIADRFPKLPVGLIGHVLVGAAFFPLFWPTEFQLREFLPYLLLLIICSGNAAFHVEGGRDSFVRARGNEIRTGIFSLGGAAAVLIVPILPLSFGRLSLDGILLLLWLFVLILLVILKSAAKRANEAYMQNTPALKISTLSIKPEQSSDTLKTVIATLFLFAQTYYLPNSSMFQLRIDSVSLTILLIVITVAGRSFGGFLTAYQGPFIFLLIATIVGSLSMFAPLNSPGFAYIKALTLTVPGAWAAWQYYLTLPHRPALAYALQKLPMFASTLVGSILWPQSSDFYPIVLSKLPFLIICMTVMVLSIIQQHRNPFTRKERTDV